MNRNVILIAMMALSAVSPAPASGADPLPELPPLSMEQLYFDTGANNPILSPIEREALNIARKWQAKDTGSLKPVQGADGSVRFLFGASQPSIVCAVMQVTDIALEAGEIVNSIHIGDTARWLIEPAITGAGVEVQHLVVKPMDVGLETSLVVTTNRRTYHMRLKSHKTEYMPNVSFIYHDAVMAKWEAQKNRQREERHTKTLPATGEYLDNLDFAYRIEGKAPWKPVRVYNDGTKTIIQMPPRMAQTEAPTLLVLNGDEEVMANYRLQDDRFIVDSLFEKAMLIAGVGSSQARIIIEKVK